MENIPEIGEETKELAEKICKCDSPTNIQLGDFNGAYSSLKSTHRISVLTSSF